MKASKAKRRSRNIGLPSTPLQLPARVHYTKTENGKRVTVSGIFRHCDERFGEREFEWQGQSLNSMSIFEFNNMVFVKPTKVQHQFKRDKNGMPVSGKGWNAIFASDVPVPGSKKRFYTLQHYRTSVGFQNDPAMTVEIRDSLCLRARDQYKSGGFITLLGTPTVPLAAAPSAAATAAPAGENKKRKQKTYLPHCCVRKCFAKWADWFREQILAVHHQPPPPQQQQQEQQQEIAFDPFPLLEPQIVQPIWTGLDEGLDEFDDVPNNNNNSAAAHRLL